MLYTDNDEIEVLTKFANRRERTSEWNVCQRMTFHIVKMKCFYVFWRKYSSIQFYRTLCLYVQQHAVRRLWIYWESHEIWTDEEKTRTQVEKKMMAGYWIQQQQKNTFIHLFNRALRSAQSRT